MRGDRGAGPGPGRGQPQRGPGGARAISGADWRAAEIAGITGLPLLAAIKAQPQLGAQVERVGLRLGRRSALAVAARQVLGVLPPAGARRKGKAA